MSDFTMDEFMEAKLMAQSNLTIHSKNAIEQLRDDVDWMESRMREVRERLERAESAYSREDWVELLGALKFVSDNAPVNPQASSHSLAENISSLSSALSAVAAYNTVERINAKK